MSEPREICNFKDNGVVDSVTCSYNFQGGTGKTHDTSESVEGS